MAGKLKLETNVPEVIALVFPTGKIKESIIPGAANDVQFSLVDGRIAFLPLIAADKIREAGVQARVPFEITKLGPHNFRVRTLQAEAGAPPVVQTVGAPASPAIASRNELQQQHNHRTGSAPQGSPDPAAIASPAPRRKGMANLLAGALIASIDAYSMAADYARSKGIPVELRLIFDGEDLRCSANTMLIEYWKTEGRDGGAQ